MESVLLTTSHKGVDISRGQVMRGVMKEPSCDEMSVMSTLSENLRSLTRSAGEASCGRNYCHIANDNHDEFDEGVEVVE